MKAPGRWPRGAIRNVLNVRGVALRGVQGEVCGNRILGAVVGDQGRSARVASATRRASSRPELLHQRNARQHFRSRKKSEASACPELRCSQSRASRVLRPSIRHRLRPRADTASRRQLTAGVPRWSVRSLNSVAIESPVVGFHGLTLARQGASVPAARCDTAGRSELLLLVAPLSHPRRGRTASRAPPKPPGKLWTAPRVSALLEWRARWSIVCLEGASELPALEWCCLSFSPPLPRLRSRLGGNATTGPVGGCR